MSQTEPYAKVTQTSAKTWGKVNPEDEPISIDKSMVSFQNTFDLNKQIDKLIELY